MTYINTSNDKFYISTDKEKLDIDLIVDYLLHKSYWAKERPEAAIRTSIQNSFCFGVYNEHGKQVGFARVVTDFAVFAWLMDVFILDEYKGKGLGKQLMEEVLFHPEVKNVIKWGLGTKDAHELYRKFGFKSLARPEVMMERTV
jgi:GNAT superfamily N-acetyltransferase